MFDLFKFKSVFSLLVVLLFSALAGLADFRTNFGISPLLVSSLGFEQVFAITKEDRIERIMEIFYLKSEIKSPYDSIELKSDSATISAWREIPPNPNPDFIECLGYQWLLSGRGTKIGDGAAKVFIEFPELNSLELRLVDLDFVSESKDGHGKLNKQAKPRTYLKLRVQRSEIEKYRIDNDKFKKQLRQDVSSCIQIGRRLKIEKEIQL